MHHLIFFYCNVYILEFILFSFYIYIFIRTLKILFHFLIIILNNLFISLK